MKTAMDAIIYWCETYYADGFFLTMTVASFFYLFVHEKESRKRLLYPVALLVFCVLNPILYYMMFHQIIYWRLFWVIPDAIIIAYALTRLVQSAGSRRERAVVLVMALAVVFVGGTNVYQNGDFVLIQNPEKVDRPVKEVCDLMLELDESPKCILPAPMLSQARQYSGQIRSMYGRNVEGYILDANEEQWSMYYEMESGAPNFNLILREASDKGYDFVVTYEQNEIKDSILERYQYREAGCLEGYRVYYSEMGSE